MADKHLQERIMTYRILESRLDSMLKQRELIANKIVEIQTTLESVDEIQNSKEEILFPVGSEAYTFGKATEKGKIIVEIGANVALEKTVDEGKQILLRRQKELENVLQEMQKNISGISTTMLKLQTEIQDLAGPQSEEQAG